MAEGAGEVPPGAGDPAQALAGRPLSFRRAARRRGRQAAPERGLGLRQPALAEQQPAEVEEVLDLLRAVAARFRQPQRLPVGGLRLRRPLQVEVQGEREVEMGVREPRDIPGPAVDLDRLAENLDRPHRIAQVAVDHPGVDQQRGAAVRLQLSPGGQHLAVEIQRFAVRPHLVEHHPLVDPGDPPLLRRPRLAPVPRRQRRRLGVEVQRRRVAPGRHGQRSQVREIDRLGFGIPRPAVELQGFAEPPFGLRRLAQRFERQAEIVEGAADRLRVVDHTAQLQRPPAVRERRPVIPEVHPDHAGVAERRGRGRRIGASGRHHRAILLEGLLQPPGRVQGDGPIQRRARREGGGGGEEERQREEGSAKHRRF